MSTIDFTSFLKLMAHQQGRLGSVHHCGHAAGDEGPRQDFADVHPERADARAQSRDLVLNAMMTPDKQTARSLKCPTSANFAIGVSGDLGRFRVSAASYQRNQRRYGAAHASSRPPFRAIEELALPPRCIKDVGDDQARHHHLRRRHRHR